MQQTKIVPTTIPILANYLADQNCKQIGSLVLHKSGLAFYEENGLFYTILNVLCKMHVKWG